MQAVYLKPRSTFPATIHSNTLFGAICSTMEELGYDTGGFIERFRDSPPLLISSCFPYLSGKNGIIHLFPMPAIPLPKNIPIEYETLKKFKKIQFVDELTFRKMVSGKLKTSGILQHLERSKEYDSKIFSISEPMTLNGSVVVDIPHNQINRLSSASEQFFHTSGTHFEGSGLFFLIRYNDRKFEQAIKASLSFMADRGIGPRVSAGQGHFDLSYGEVELPEFRDSAFLTTLSRFMPVDITSFGDKIWYDLVAVRGRSSDGFMKRRVMMLGEGAVFSNVPDIKGQIAHVRSNPPVVEYGLPFLIGMGCLS